MGRNPLRLFPLKLASTLSTESWGNRESGGPSSNHSTETTVLIPSKLNVVQPCAGGFLQGLPPGLLPMGGLDGRRKEVEQVSSPSTRVRKAQPFSGKRSGGELATCPGGMAPDRL